MDNPSAPSCWLFAWYSIDGSCNVFLQIAHESNEVDHDHTATAFHFFTSIFLLLPPVVPAAAAPRAVAPPLSASMASSTISLMRKEVLTNLKRKKEKKREKKEDWVLGCPALISKLSFPLFAGERFRKRFLDFGFFGSFAPKCTLKKRVFHPHNSTSHLARTRELLLE